MNELDKLIEQYSDYLDTLRYNKELAKEILPRLLDESESMIKNFVQWLASRPTCGVEQRKFLDEVEIYGYLDLAGDLRTHGLSVNLENTLIEKSRFTADLTKVIKGE